MTFFPRRDHAEAVELTISISTFVRIVVLIVATTIVLAALRTAAHSLTLIFIAFFLALALNAPVHWVTQHMPGKMRGSRALGTTIAFLIVIILLGAFIASLVPPLVRQTESFVNAAPRLVKDVREQHGAVGDAIRRYHLQGQVSTFSSQLSQRLKNLSGTAFSTLSKIGTSVFSMLAILALTFMMLVEGPRWLAFFARLVPKRHRKDARQLSLDMYRVVKGYVNGQVTLAAIASAFLLPALLLLHISYPVALVVVVFICGLIPMVGHTLGAIIVTTVALFHSPTHALIILIYYILYQQLENYLIQPRIQANTTNLSPLLVFSAVIIGVSFSGLIGGLVAIPVMGCLRVLVLYYLEERDLISKAELEETIAPAKT